MSKSFIFVLSIVSCTLPLKSIADDVKPLKKLTIPPLDAFSEGHFDVRKSEVIQWIHDIESFLQTEIIDYSVRCEINEEMRSGDGHWALFAWAHSFRMARHPSKDSTRIISVRQNLLDNTSIASNNGIAFDNRSHLDVHCEGLKCMDTRVTAYAEHTSEQVGEEYNKTDQIEELRLRGIFDPCFAATVSPHQTSRGYSMDFSEHNFRAHAIRSVIRQGDRIHVLLRFKGSPRKCQIATFEEKVPVQVCVLEWAGDDESEAKLTAITRSMWAAPNGTKQKLPVQIQGVRSGGGRPCELIASIEWKIGNDVDQKLFDRSTLGFRNPVPESDFGIPLLLR